MGLMQRAYETYCAMESKYAGEYITGQNEPLVPIAHQIVNANIEITLDEEGNFINAASIDKSQAAIIIPVTEKSSGRTGNTSRAHPLCDQLRFLAPYSGEKYDVYITQLRAWESSDFSHPKLYAILQYVQKGTILTDLQKFGLIKLNDNGIPFNEAQEKLVVCWRVLSHGNIEIPECWKDKSLFQAFIGYYTLLQNQADVFCMVSGEQSVPASQHPKGIISVNGNAKLVSANDSSGFTYRGRFTDDQQAATVSYVASQKAHSALRWIVANQGVSYGGRTFLCWNPQGISLPQPSTPILRKSAQPRVKPSDYKKELQTTLKGWRECLPADTSAVIAAFDAATSGRLSLTYYSELQASDFLDRLHDWDATCCWWNGSFGVQAPSLFQIVNCAFGTLRAGNNQTKLETDECVMRQQLQRLIACRVDKGKFPLDIEQSLVKRSSNLQIYESGMREMTLSTTCAVIRKYRFDRNGEEWEMALAPNKKDISYQYGRLLAVFEKTERDTYDREESRETNAIRMQSVFAQRPQYASRILWEQLKKAYYPQLKPGSRLFYDRLLGEILNQISEFPEAEQNRPLGDTYLLGYYLQRNDLYQSKTKQSETEE
ncbi:MAG: type I-C CRISPR-associated protein Cas8c/Csd1 [Faecousia sp.]